MQGVLLRLNHRGKDLENLCQLLGELKRALPPSTSAEMILQFPYGVERVVRSVPDPLHSQPEASKYHIAGKAIDYWVRHVRKPKRKALSEYKYIPLRPNRPRVRVPRCSRHEIKLQEKNADQREVKVLGKFFEPVMMVWAITPTATSQGKAQANSQTSHVPHLFFYSNC